MLSTVPGEARMVAKGRIPEFLSGICGDTYKESMDGIRKPINRAYLTLVAVDGEGKPTTVPDLVINSEAERAEWEAGMRRKEIRKQRKEEGF